MKDMNTADATPARLRLVLWLVVILAALTTAITFLIPVAPTAANPVATHWRTAAGTASLCLFLGAAVEFLRGLGGFKPGLRSAYRLLAFGIMAWSTVLIQLVIWGMLDLWNSAWADSGSGLVPFFVTSALIYAGTRKFARLIGVRGPFTSWRVMVPVSVGTGIIFGIAATYLVQYHIEGTNTYIGVAALCTACLTFSAVLAYKIYDSIGLYYKNAMKWLAVGFTALAVSAAHETINTFWFNNGDVYTDYGWYLIPWVITGLLLVRASYQFRLLAVTEGTTTGTGGMKAEHASRKDYIDSIIEVAGLVSNRMDVRSALDILREVTAEQKSDEPLKDEDKKRLLKAYSELEDYLGRKDVLRSFSKDAVRTHVTPAFLAVLEQREAH
ncbi:MAG TPA: hypothetical protein VHQ86_02950 [Candidatus Saccharimonadia bacterium]|nr:hypothetical protein [Candidatus Saccharimonadia bacterium]